MISSGPSDGSTTTATNATFSFTSDRAGVRFRCSLDGSKFRWCSSPVTYSSLGLGIHTFEVEAVRSGVTGPAATSTWTVVTATVTGITGTGTTGTGTTGSGTSTTGGGTGIITTTADTTPPTAPGNLTASASDKQVALSWSASTDDVGVAGYHVYRNGSQIAQTGGTSFTDTGLTDGTSYSYYVTAYDAAGNVSAASNTVLATPASATPPSSEMWVGMGTWDWGSTVAGQVSSALGGGYVRWNSGAGAPTNYTSQGIKAIINFAGTCVPDCTSGNGASSNGVSAINASAWASSAIAWYQANCTLATCPAIELLNEPGGPWFWGSNALAQANATTYAQMIVDTWNDFHNQYGSSAPKLLASYDGGYSGGSAWGPEVYSANANIGNYVDGWTVHPYGGTSDATLSAQGNRANIANAHSNTGKPIYVTEVGWPTDCSSSCPSSTNETGDSYQWSETQQADNIYNFVAWARSTGYIAAVTFYQYTDDGGNALYGLTRSDGTRKPGWTALSEAAQFQSCTVC